MINEALKVPRLGNPHHFSSSAAHHGKRQEAAAQKSLSPERRQNLNPKIEKRYSTRELLAIFKSLGRFQSPLDEPKNYGDVDTEMLAKLLNPKATVVLQHMKSSSALPLVVGQDQRIREKIIDSVSEQIRKVF